MPALIKNYNKYITLNRLKKSYSEVAQVLKLSEIDNGSMDSWNYQLEADEFLRRYLIPYFKVAKFDKVQTLNQKTQYKTLNGQPYTNALLTGDGNDWVSKYITLPNGAFLIVDGWYDDEKRRYVAIDTNGLKGPNTLGKDVFEFIIVPIGIISPGIYNKASLSKMQTVCSKNGSGSYCADLIIINNWQFPDDYPW